MKIAAIIAASVAIAFIFATGSRMAYAATFTQVSNITPVKKTRRLKKIVTVKRGDYLYKLAKMYSTTMQRLFYANTQVKDPNLVYPGEELVVPNADEQLTPRPWPGASDSPARPATTSKRSPDTAGDSDDSNVKAEATSPPTPAPVPVPVPTATTSTVSGSVWDSLAQCESGGNWSINTGNGYYGGLQFTLGSWQSVGGTGYPSDASRNEQIALAKRLLATQGWSAWPACSAQLGL